MMLQSPSVLLYHKFSMIENFFHSPLIPLLTFFWSSSIVNTQKLVIATIFGKLNHKWWNVECLCLYDRLTCDLEGKNCVTNKFDKDFRCTSHWTYEVSLILVKLLSQSVFTWSQITTEYPMQCSYHSYFTKCSIFRI